MEKPTAIEDAQELTVDELLESVAFMTQKEKYKVILSYREYKVRVLSLYTILKM
jgi:hypothetical protein